MVKDSFPGMPNAFAVDNRVIGDLYGIFFGTIEPNLTEHLVYRIATCYLRSSDRKSLPAFQPGTQITGRGPSTNGKSTTIVMANITVHRVATAKIENNTIP